MPERCSNLAPRSLLRRVAIVGTTGSGKTTLARRLATCLGLRHIELDALHWDPNWSEAAIDVFRDRTSRALAGDGWVVDGNYSKVRDIVWGRADTVVWLDYPLWLVLTRLLRRTVWRGVARTELWNGNRERLWPQLCSRDSLILWALQSYPRHRAEYPRLFQRPEYQHLSAVRLRSARAAVAWLARVCQRSSVSDHSTTERITGRQRYDTDRYGRRRKLGAIDHGDEHERCR